tara:strand:+ start:1327 stop:2013 length:687 start_codon:yes stop_codon:yes gene_type:complete
MKIVALLPMKANSERVKGKNFKNFCGKPLFKWVLDKLLDINEISEVIINTDAQEILYENGMEDNEKILVRNRRKEICGDLVSMNLIINDDVQNIDADIYLMTHTTNPLISIDTIKKAISKFTKALESNQNIDSLFSVNLIQERYYDSAAKPINHDPNNLVRTQDLEPWFKENSNLYLFTKASFMKTKARIGEKPMMLVTPANESIDIDNPDDWDLAELMVEYLSKKEN